MNSLNDVAKSAAVAFGSPEASLTDEQVCKVAVIAMYEHLC